MAAGVPQTGARVKVVRRVTSATAPAGRVGRRP
jgi:hypothetical protein